VLQERKGIERKEREGKGGTNIVVGGVRARGGGGRDGGTGKWHEGLKEV